MTKSAATKAGDARPSDAALDAILDAVRGLCDGPLEVQLHDARVVKILRTEQIRSYEECATRAPVGGTR
jgi:hypothetical protein